MPDGKKWVYVVDDELLGAKPPTVKPEQRARVAPRPSYSARVEIPHVRWAEAKDDVPGTIWSGGGGYSARSRVRRVTALQPGQQEQAGSLVDDLKLE